MVQSSGRRGQTGGADRLWKRCRGCGRQFRSAADAGGVEVEYCPVCDYRRLRDRLGQASPDTGEEDEVDQGAE